MKNFSNPQTSQWGKVLLSLLFLIFLSAGLQQAGAETPAVLRQPLLTKEMVGGDSQMMVRRWLWEQTRLAQKKWEADFAALKTPAEIEKYAQLRRDFFWKSIGGKPEEKTPLNPQLRGKIQRNGYAIEKILLESQPNFFVSGLIYLPDQEKFKYPRPGVMLALGHSDNGKSRDLYQIMAASLALNGFVVWTFDPLDQNERFQIVDPQTPKARFWGQNGGCANAHNLFGVSSALLGRNLAYFEVWDLVRGIDYLQSRPEVIPEKIGVCGTSGGGTQTAYIMALDDRVTAAAPSCYICSLYALMLGMGPHDAEQNLFGQAALGMDHADYFVMRAPKPTLLCAAERDYFPYPSAQKAFTNAQQVFKVLGKEENVQFSHADSEHSYAKPNREATVSFFLKHLCGQDVQVTESPDIQILQSNEELNVSKTGFVKDEPNAKTAYDLNREYARALAEKRKARGFSDAQIPEVRAKAGIRPFAEIPMPKIVTRSESAPLEPGVRFEKIIFSTEPGIFIPAFRFMPENADTNQKLPTVLYANSNGKAAAYERDIRSILQAGKAVLSIDLPGWGETQAFSRWYYDPPYLGVDGMDFYTMFLVGKTHVGLRADVLLALTRWLQSLPETGTIDLFARYNATIPALHAAACEPSLFHSLELREETVTWSHLVENAENSTLTRTATVFGALEVYDLPDLKNFLARKGLLADRRSVPFPKERLIQDWMRQDKIQNFASPEEKEKYLESCMKRRAERLKNVSGFAQEYIFVKHCQLSNQPAFASTAFLSDSIYKDRLGDWRVGSELYRLKIDEKGEISIHLLLEQPKGIIRDPNVSFDGKTLAFSMRESEADDYHIYTMDLRSGKVKQITFGPGTADIEPCWLPNGDLIFNSTRCGICVPCWSSDVTNIYRCDAQGRYIRRLTFDHAHNVLPSVLNDGRIVYTRWEYNDRNSNPVHKLFQMNADGTMQTEFYGNNSITPHSLIHPAAIPGSSKILVIGSGHHTDQSGKLMRIDRTKGTQEDEGLEYVSPLAVYEPVWEDFFGQKGPLYQYPTAIDEKNWLVSYVFEGGPPRGKYPIPFGIYWMNEAGERELLAYDPTISSCQIVPVRERKAPLEKAGNFDLSQEHGFFYVQNIYYGPGLKGVPKGSIKKIRVVGLENRAMSAGVGYQQPGAQVHTPISVGNGSWDVKHVLGTVDVEEDGSCFFKVPPRMGVYFQMLDENGHMIQTMRSWAMVLPGETFGCIGCHEDKRDTFIDSRAITEALKRPPQEIQPLYAPGEIPEPEFHASLTESEKKAIQYLNINAPQRMDVPQGFSYLRDIQPIWDTHCVSCHDGSSEKVPLNLLADTKPYTWKESYKDVELHKPSPARPYINTGKDTNTGRLYAGSYLELTNYGRVTPAGKPPVHPDACPASIQLIEEFGESLSKGNSSKYVNWLPLGMSLPPMIPADFWGAKHSPIMKYLETSHYGVKVSQHEKDLVAAWIDLCVPYCGSYMEANSWDRMTHTYVHFYRDKSRPTYLFQEAKRLRYAEIEVAHLEKWKENLETGKEFQPEDFPKNVLGGMDEQARFVREYEALPQNVPVFRDPAGNLALNPNASTFSLTSMPWTTSNSHYGYRKEFAPTNASDGKTETFWRPNRRNDLYLKIDFGREVKVSRCLLTLHLEANQKKTWNSAVLEFSNGEKVPVSLKCSAEPQEFKFKHQTCTWVKLTELKEEGPLSANGVAEIEIFE